MASSHARPRQPLASASAPEDLLALFSQAVRCHQSGQLAEAISLYEQLLAREPRLPEVQSNLGVALSHLGRWPEAESAYRQAIALKPDYADAYNNLGSVVRDSGRAGEAEAVLRQAIALKPRYADAYNNLGNVLRDLGRLAEAELTLRDAIALRPDDPAAYSNLGNALRDLGRPAEAEAAYRRAIGLRPQFAEAHTNLGSALKDQGRFGEAEVAHREAIALRPTFVSAHVNLGNALREQHKLDGAVAAYRQAIALKPDHADAHNNLSATLKELGRLDEARSSAQEALRLAPRNALYLLNLGDFGPFGAGDGHLATMQELARSAETLPVKDRIELHFGLGKACEDVGRYEDAFRHWGVGGALKRQQISYDEATTVGAFERARAVFTAEMMRDAPGVDEPSRLPIFIVGMARSGTTLVEQILASHPQVCGAGELKLFEQAVGAVCAEGAANFPELAARMSGEQIRGLGARYAAGIGRLAPDAARITDKMPSNFIFCGLIHRALPNATIIHTVRDPLDTCVSCFSKLFSEGQAHTYDLAELGRYYRGYRALMAHWRDVLPPGRILDVRYEDVVADLEGQARRILAHCGLAWDARCLDFHRTERPIRTASATQVRQPIYQRSIGRWRAYEPFLEPLRAELGPAAAS